MHYSSMLRAVELQPCMVSERKGLAAKIEEDLPQGQGSELSIFQKGYWATLIQNKVTKKKNHMSKVKSKYR